MQERTVRRLAKFSLALVAPMGPGVLITFWLFLLTGPWNLAKLGLDAFTVMLFDGGLCILFFLQHSLMVRRSFRRGLARWLPEVFLTPLYTITSGMALLTLMLFWQESGLRLFDISGFWRLFFYAGYAVSLAGFAWCIKALDQADSFGVAGLVDYLKGRTSPAPEFVVRGPYRWVRHPIYFFSILMIWSRPDWTADRLLLNLLWTGWILLAVPFEERDLVRAFGENYRVYQQSVPRLIPCRVPYRL